MGIIPQPHPGSSAWIRPGSARDPAHGSAAHSSYAFLYTDTSLHIAYLDLSVEGTASGEVRDGPQDGGPASIQVTGGAHLHDARHRREARVASPMALNHAAARALGDADALRGK